MTVYRQVDEAGIVQIVGARISGDRIGVTEVGVTFTARKFHDVRASVAETRRRRSPSFAMRRRFLASADVGRRRHRRHGQVDETLVRRRSAHAHVVAAVFFRS